ncbi:MAG: helix-hairpin-helix domain-containing protein [Salinibacter sp.]|uniref:helix-hairpin-helix domain-containing protein n=1 Tax=Salinibacter sp. TaxID=2065818 RepID=UPI002FC349A8
MELIKEYPTPTQVLEAGPEELAEIPYVSKEKAESIVAAARTSMVSQTDEETGLTLSLIAEDLLRLEKRIDRLKARQKEKSETTERADDSPIQEGDLTAPISRREANRRGKATSPQKSGSSSERDRGAFP